MRVIKAFAIRQWAKHHPDAAASLGQWLKIARQARWENFADLRKTCCAADQVKVASGRPVIVFNIAGNAFRLIAAVHFDRQRIFTLRFLTHAEYSKNRWKNEL